LQARKQHDLEAGGISVDMANIQKLTNGEGRFRQDVANLKAGEHRPAAQVQRQEEFWPQIFYAFYAFSTLADASDFTRMMGKSNWVTHSIESTRVRFYH